MEHRSGTDGGGYQGTEKPDSNPVSQLGDRPGIVKVCTIHLGGSGMYGLLEHLDIKARPAIV